MTIKRVAIIGLGLLGGSIGLAIKARGLAIATSGYDRDPAVRAKAAERGLVGQVCETAAEAVTNADLVILCVPVGAMSDAARALAPGLAPHAIISDVGSSKQAVADALAAALPGACIIPAHPVAGTEQSGPEAGFAALFAGRWCIITPPDGVDPAALAALSDFWTSLGSKVELMDAAHHDLVLAVTSHIPHLIAYTIVGTASDLEDVTQSEVIKYSAGGFRDFTRIAASSPEMWRDICMANREALLRELLQYASELHGLYEALEQGDTAKLEEVFSEARTVRSAWTQQ